VSGTLPAGVWRVAGQRLFTIRRLLAAFSILAGGAGAAGCRTSSGETALTAGAEPPGAAAAWPVILIAAQSDVDQGRHAEADRALRAFAAEYARSPEALESTYWRAVFMLDPANTTATPRDAGALLERYVASNAPLAHRAEAAVLHRLVKSLTTPREGGSARASDAVRDAELKALKDELEQTKAELERIKKRVAPPPPPSTPPPLPDAE